MKRRRCTGFTLVELLVAFTVLAMLTILLAAAMRLAGQAWDGGQRRAERDNELRLTQELLRRQLAAALPVYARVDGEARLRFVGESDTLLFVAALPPYVAGGGLQELRIELEGSGRSRSLVLGHVPFEQERDAPPRADDYRRVVLAEAVRALRIAYYGSEDGARDPRWWSSWDSGRRLPALVAIEVEFDGAPGRAWPPLAVRLRIDADSAPAPAGAVVPAPATVPASPVPDGTAPGRPTPGSRAPQRETPAPARSSATAARDGRLAPARTTHGPSA